MHGFRRTLFLSHLGLVALTLLLLALTLRGLALKFFEAQLRDQIIIEQAAPVRNLIKNHVNATGFDPKLSPAQRRTLQRQIRKRARQGNVHFRLINRDGVLFFDSASRGAASGSAVNDSFTDSSSANAQVETSSSETSPQAVSDLKASAKAGAPLDVLPPVEMSGAPLNLDEWPEVPLALQGDTNSRVRGSLRDGAPLMFVATPIRRDDAIVGCVHVASPILMLTPNGMDFARSLGLVMAGIFVLAIALSIALSLRLSLPARRLEEAAHRLAAGDLSSRAPMHKRLLGQGDEMDSLTREFNRMAEKIEAVDEERRAFLADVSHELRTPLCAIKGSAETLRDGAWQDARFAPRFAGTIVAQSDRLIRLVGDLLKLARLEAASTGDDAARFQQPIAARELCERASSAVAPLFEARGVRLRVECEIEEVRGDADLLEQLLINLLANAARHSPPGSTTTLLITRDGSGVLLQVRDQGCGIAPEHLPKLGRRFYRVEEGRERVAANAAIALPHAAPGGLAPSNGSDAAANDSESGLASDNFSGSGDSSGSGLGLAICRRIALAHGGTLEIESEVGSGTTVTVALPAG